MRQNLLLSLTACLLFAACADHKGNLLATAGGPEAPVNQPDSGTWSSPERTGDTPNTSVPGTTNTEGEGTGGSGGANAGGGESGGGGSGGGAPPGGGGGEGGGPVPEPGTLLLVGTGLAGASLLRRRRRETR